MDFESRYFDAPVLSYPNLLTMAERQQPNRNCKAAENEN